ncbi:MAG: hypothetical protein Q9169_005466 [Polycauliona sp. 2 TL-2023]
MQARTPLHLTTAFNYLTCTQTLLTISSSSLNLNLLDTFHQTPLLIAQIYEFHEIAFALIEAGAGIDKEVIQVQKLFFLAVEFARPRAVERLLGEGAVVGMKNVGGKTAWRIAREGVGGMGVKEGVGRVVIGEREGRNREEDMGEVLRVLRMNKSRVVARRVEDGRSGVGDVDEEEEQEGEDDERRFQMSAFRRADIFDEESDHDEDENEEKEEESERPAPATRRKVAVLA